MATSAANGAEPEGKSGAPRRLRWSVPAVDGSTNRWLDLQNGISHSLQLLIRESIQRDGYIDVVNRPVEQMPRRGRPSGETTEQSGQSTRPPQSEAADDEQLADDEREEEQPPVPEPEAVPEEPAGTAVPEQSQQPPAQPGKSGLDAFLTS